MIKKIGLVCTITFIAIILVLAGLLYTNTGTQITWRFTQSFLPETVKVEKVSGAIASDLIIENIEFKTETMHFETQEAKISWNALALFKGQLSIESIGMSNGQLALTPTDKVEKEPASNEPFTLPEQISLPLDLQLNDIYVENFTIKPADSAPIEITSFHGGVHLTEEAFVISKLTLRSSIVDIDSDAKLTPNQPYGLDGKLDWAVTLPDYPQIIGNTLFKGDLSELVVNQSVQPPYENRLAVTIKDPLEKLMLDGKLELVNIDTAGINTSLPPINTTTTLLFTGGIEDFWFQINSQLLHGDIGKFTIASEGSLKANKLRIKQLDIAPEGINTKLSSKGMVDLNAQPLTFKLNADWQNLRWPLEQSSDIISPTGQLKLNGNVEDINANIIANLVDNGKLSADVNFANDQINAQATGTKIKIPSEDAPLIETLEAKLSGTTEAYKFSASTSLLALEDRKVKVKANGTGSTEQAKLAQLSIVTKEGESKGSGEVQWSPHLKGKFNFNGENFDPSVIAPEWQGNLNYTLKTNFSVDGENKNISVSPINVSGQLRDQPISVTSAISIKGETINISPSTLRLGDVTATGEGSIGDEINLTFKVDGKDLSHLLATLSGSLTADGKLSGTKDSPVISLTASGENLRFEQHSAEKLLIEAVLDESGNTHSELKLIARGINSEDIQINNLNINADGTPEKHTIALSVDGQESHAELKTVGQFEKQEKSWQFNMQSLQFKVPRVEEWRLDKSFTGKIASNNVIINPFCLSSNGAQACADVSYQNDILNASYDIEALAIDQFNLFYPENWRIDGAISGKGSITQSSNADLLVSSEITLSAGQIAVNRVSDDDDASEELLVVTAFDQSKLTIGLQDNELNVDTRIGLADNGSVYFSLNSPAQNVDWPQRKMSASLETEITSLAFIEQLVPNINNLKGTLTTNFDIGGTFSVPTIDGSGELVNAELGVAEIGVNIKNINADLKGLSDKVTFNLTADSGKGNIKVTGDSSLDKENLVLNSKVSGTNFQVANNSIAQVNVNPNLNVNIENNIIHMRGDLTAPYANITVEKSGGPSGVSITGDQVIVSDEDAPFSKEATGYELDARLRVKLGDEVNFEGQGLVAKFGGELLIIDPPNDPVTTASGEILIVEGQYQSYGQDLNIQNGRVIFSGGPIDRPGIDIRATRIPAEGIVVGVEARGTLSSPNITVFSNPSMSQSEQLSYLILGRPLEQSSEGEQSALNNLVLAAGLKGGDFLAEKIGSKIGVDEISVGTKPGESSERAALTVGKYITPKLYVSYGVGIFEPISTLRTRYDINSKWKFVTETTEEASGGDIIYTIETGGK